MAGPYIPSHQDEIEELLRNLKLEKGKVLIELGSGDGRVVRIAAKKYGIKGIGVEMHPLVCMWAKFLGRNENVKFICGSFFDMKLPEADYYYIYLTPKGTNQVGEQIFLKLPEGKVVISKAFEIKDLKKNLFQVIKVRGNKFFVYLT